MSCSAQLPLCAHPALLSWARGQSPRFAGDTDPVCRPPGRNWGSHSNGAAAGGDPREPSLLRAAGSRSVQRVRNRRESRARLFSQALGAENGANGVSLPLAPKKL